MKDLQTRLLKLKNYTGTLPKFERLGSQTLVYVIKGNAVCNVCATKHILDITDLDLYDEEKDLECDMCHEPIISSLGSAPRLRSARKVA